MSKCKMGCGRSIRYPEIGVCHACYQFVYYWRKKSTKEILKRQDTLAFWASRMQQMMPEKVARLPRKRKAG